MIRNEYQAELGLCDSDFFQTLHVNDLHPEGVVGEELVHRMASKREKVVHKVLC